MAIMLPDMQAVATRGWWLTESTTPPATPVLSVANDGNGTSVTATVTGAGGATHRLYYMARGGTAWTAGGSRVGNGDIAQAGLTAGTYYFLVQSSLASLLSVPSALEVVGVVSSTVSVQLEDAVYHHCADSVGIAALVGTRIYRIGSVPSSVTASQDYLSYQRISTQRAEHQAAADAIADARVQINCWSATATGAKALADAVRGAWANVSGAIGAAGSTVSLEIARVRDESGDYVEPHDAGQVGKHRYIVDVLLWYSE